MTLPTCVGFIMDGNRRWAQEQGLSSIAGHQSGVEVFGHIVKYVHELGIAHAVFYAFSTENSHRAPDEVQGLLNIFMETLNRREGVRVRVIGERHRFSSELQQAIARVEADTAQIAGTTVWIALSWWASRNSPGDESGECNRSNCD